MGKYQGGRLWIEIEGGKRHPPNLPESSLRGQYHETKYRRVMFDPKRSHAVEPCVGSRLSVVFFTPARLHALEDSHCWPRYTSSNLTIDHVCFNAWFEDLDAAVPSSNLPSLADVTHEWERRHRQGHLTKLPSCPACQKESGPRIVHKRTKASERKIGVLHGDLAHMGLGLNKFLWVLVLVAVVEVDDILTVIPFDYPLDNKASERVLTCVREVILWIRNSQYCSSITAGRFIQRFMSDNGGEFTSKPFIHGLHQLGVTLTTAPSYQPQSNGMAERCVGLMKILTAVRRLLVAANLVTDFGHMRSTLLRSYKKLKLWVTPGINRCLASSSRRGV
eukprot:3119718-Amphidinium_carterae.2